LSPTTATALGIPAGAQKAKVSRNVDGDTIWAEPLEVGSLPTGAAHKIRILEIDTPEIYGGTVECFGPEASAFAKRELPVGSVIALFPDKEDKDRYGRFLRYVWQEDGDFFNDMAVRLGFARAVLYMPNDLYIGQMREAEAKANIRGLWAACASKSSTASRVATPPHPSHNCHASYPDFCIPPPPPDKNCADFSKKNFTVRWDVPDPDPHKLDGDKDWKGCEH
jgi:micrococcal nuclease